MTVFGIVHRAVQPMLAVVLALAIGTPGLAQLFSLDPASPEVVAGGFSAADLLVSPRPAGPPNVAIPAANMNLFAGDNIDALSNGFDPLLPCVISGAAALYFSVERNTAAAANAADMFAVYSQSSCLFGPRHLSRNTLSFGLDPRPAPESNIDALSGGGPRLYFSLDSASAVGHGGDGATIWHVAPGAGAVKNVYATFNQLNLAPGDDIDVLVVLDLDPLGVLSAGDIVHVSLAPGSPSAPLLGGPGSLILVHPAANPIVEVFPSLFGLGPNEDLDAASSFDPVVVTIDDRNVAGGVPITVSDDDLDGLRDGTTGFARRYVSGDGPFSFTAPASVGAQPFRRWYVDSVPQPIGQTTVNVTPLTTAMTIECEYKDSTARFSTFGVGCSGTNGQTPTLSFTGVPSLCLTYAVNLRRGPPNAQGVLFIGFSNTQWGGAPILPFDLGWIGGFGCTVYSSDDIVLTANANASGSHDKVLPTPCDTAFLGLAVYYQWLMFNGINPLGIITSNAGQGNVGW